MQFDPRPTIDSGVPVLNEAVNPVLSEAFAADPATSINPLHAWTAVAAVVWLLGVAGMLCYALVSWLRLRRRVRASICLR